MEVKIMNFISLSISSKVYIHTGFGICYYRSIKPVEIFDEKLLKSKFKKKYPTLIP
jgi:hypothetical protein